DQPHDPAALLERAAAGGPAAGVGSASRARGARGASGAGGGRGAAARRCLRLPGGELGLLLAGPLGGCLLAGAAAPLGELLLADPAPLPRALGDAKIGRASCREREEI